MGYLISIKVAILVFPALAFFITLPYMIINYRKYGSINKLRTLIVYSFILYLLAVYLLVVLPLPNRDSIHNSYKDMLNLSPFSFIMDFIKDNPFVLSKPATWFRALKHPTFYVPAFNVLMLIPFGVYLRYYFKCSFKKTLLLTAMLSLFFELTQFSGLYFIYPGPYRLADIDDIIQNTAGGCIGYFLGRLAMHFLPSREEIDEKALQDGLRVSSIRFCLSLIIDLWIVYIPYTISKTSLPFWVFLTLYFSLIPLFNGKTFASALLKFAIEFEDAKWVRTIIRGGLLMGYFYLIPSGLMYLMNEFNKDAESISFLLMFPITYLILILFAVITIVSVLFNRPFLFDKISGTSYKSTVKNK
jgi:vanZ/RDD domain protein